MIEYWTEFARTGDPNTFRRHRFPEPFWPHFPGRDEDEDIQSLEPAGVHVESDFATRHHCAFWDAHGV
jgi:para-nitrobenzyl esterase